MTRIDKVKLDKELVLTEKERKQILFQRAMRWGRLVVIIKDSEPVRLEERLKSIEL